jgi:hypothetical protein
MNHSDLQRFDLPDRPFYFYAGVHFLCPHKPRIWFTVNHKLTRNIPHCPVVKEAYIQNGWPHRPHMKPIRYRLPDNAQIEMQEKKNIAS